MVTEQVDRYEGAQSPQLSLLRWTHPLAIIFGAAQIIAGIVFFFAYNWRDLPDIYKIALPQMVMVVAFFVFAWLPRSSPLGQTAGIAATVMIGIAMGVVGQVYQLGADPWRLFVIWGALAVVMAAVTRNDGQFFVAFLTASAGYFLFMDQEMNAFISDPDSVISALYAIAVCVLLMAREAFSRAVPRWLRLFLVAAALFPVMIAATGELLWGGIFKTGFASSLVLVAIAGAFIAAYTRWRGDDPSRTTALLALGFWTTGFGFAVIFYGFNDGIDADIFFLPVLLAGVWVIGVTTAFSITWRRLAVAGKVAQ